MIIKHVAFFSRTITLCGNSRSAKKLQQCNVMNDLRNEWFAQKSKHFGENTKAKKNKKIKSLKITKENPHFGLTWNVIYVARVEHRTRWRLSNQTDRTLWLGWERLKFSICNNAGNVIFLFHKVVALFAPFLFARSFPRPSEICCKQLDVHVWTVIGLLVYREKWRRGEGGVEGRREFVRTNGKLAEKLFSWHWRGKSASCANVV